MTRYLTWTAKLSYPVKIQEDCYRALVEEGAQLPPFDEWVKYVPEEMAEDQLYPDLIVEITSEMTTEDRP